MGKWEISKCARARAPRHQPVEVEFGRHGTVRAGLAQLVVHLICNQGVGGSIPSAGTIFSCIFNRLSAVD